MNQPQFEEFSNVYKNVNFIKIDVDQCIEIVSSQAVLGIPSIFVYKDGKKVDELVGTVIDVLEVIEVINYT